MGALRKLSRQKARLFAKKMAIADRNADKQAYMQSLQIQFENKEVGTVLKARCHIHAIIGLYLLLKEFHISSKELLGAFNRFATLDWCLAHSYTADGKEINKPSVSYGEMEQCLRDECKLVMPRFSIEEATTKQSFCRQKLDGCLLTSLFLTRVCFGFGHIRLTRLMEQMRTLMHSVTFEKYIEMGRYVIRRLGYDEQAKMQEFATPDEFGAWIYA